MGKKQNEHLAFKKRAATFPNLCGIVEKKSNCYLNELVVICRVIYVISGIKRYYSITILPTDH